MRNTTGRVVCHASPHRERKNHEVSRCPPASWHHSELNVSFRMPCMCSTLWTQCGHGFRSGPHTAGSGRLLGTTRNHHQHCPSNHIRLGKPYPVRYSTSGTPRNGLHDRLHPRQLQACPSSDTCSPIQRSMQTTYTEESSCTSACTCSKRCASSHRDLPPRPPRGCAQSIHHRSQAEVSVPVALLVLVRNHNSPKFHCSRNQWNTTCPKGGPRLCILNTCHPCTGREMCIAFRQHCHHTYRPPG